MESNFLERARESRGGCEFPEGDGSGVASEIELSFGRARAGKHPPLHGRAHLWGIMRARRRQATGEPETCSLGQVDALPAKPASAALAHGATPLARLALPALLACPASAATATGTAGSCWRAAMRLSLPPARRELLPRSCPGSGRLPCGLAAEGGGRSRGRGLDWATLRPVLMRRRKCWQQLATRGGGWSLRAGALAACSRASGIGRGPRRPSSPRSDTCSPPSHHAIPACTGPAPCMARLARRRR